ncbi:CdaR family protein [Candidatus Marinimicrobia bacterium]|jgi:YbbR domain-containing protein|nr:CdaR family protein [Candidatus Neomarinimicrobiota bacterium]MDC0521601.1 CdaR family protein [Candidatus Neomarinimicrobiota bacterium]MDC1021351.1 CdaR family protein [Candidatus Neomarinimicrobiota bacterium]
MLTNTNQIKRLLYSFVIAFIFWFFIKSEDTYSITTSIPLVARNLQEQKTYKEEVPESIIVTLKGSGRAFIWLRFFDNFYEDYKAVIDLSSIADEYNFELDQYYKNNPEKIVLPASLELEFVEVISPRSIKINLDQYLVKKVPIKSEVIVSTAPGYIQAGEEVFFPDSISIGGPQEIVDSINFVKTQKDTLVDLVSSIESEFLIINPDKVVDFDPKKVKGFIDIQPISETIVTGIPVKLINKPNDVNVFVNPATVSLTIVGGLDQIASIVSTDIEVLINFEKSWSADKQFYSPEVRIPDSILEWKDLSPNNLEILVIKEIN